MIEAFVELYLQQKKMKLVGVFVLVVALVVLVYNGSEASLMKGFRPPAVPLILNDPYMNIWSPGDNLTDSWSVYVFHCRSLITCFNICILTALTDCGMDL